MQRDSPFWDKHAVSGAVANATSVKEALAALGYRPGPNNYQRLKEACERYSLRYPRANNHRDPSPAKRPGGKFHDLPALKEALSANASARAALLALGLSLSGKNYAALTRACHFYGLTPPYRSRSGRKPVHPSERFGSREVFVDAVKASSSITGVLSKLGRHPTDWQWVKEASRHHGVELPNGNFARKQGRPRRALEDVLVENSTYCDNQALKRRLIEEGLLTDECESCGLPPVWQGKPIILQLEHRNGVRNDNRLENLGVLCPNCHSQTDTYTGRNRP